MAKRTYRFHLQQPMDEETFVSVASVPGVFAKERVIVAPLSAAWIVERLLKARNVFFNLQSPKASRRYTIDDLHALTELREWTFDFLAGYQKEGVLFAANGPDESGVLVHATGAGKSLSGIVWSLLNPGACLFITKANARRTIQLEVERYTTIRPLVLWPPSDRRFVEGQYDDLHAQRIVIVGWESLPLLLDRLLDMNPTSVVFDECFPPKTPVLTQRGWIAIDEVEVGEQVLSRSSAGEWEWKTVLRRHAKKLTKNLVRVAWADGVVICTRNHAVWTEERGYVEASDVGNLHVRSVQSIGDRQAPKRTSAPRVLQEVRRSLGGEAGEETAERQDVRRVRRSGLSSIEGQEERPDPLLLLPLRVDMEDSTTRNEREGGCGDARNGCEVLGDSGVARSQSGEQSCADAAQQPHARSEGARESYSGHARPDVPLTGRKWSAHSTTEVARRTDRTADGIPDFGRRCARRIPELANELQGRSGRADGEVGDRGRWLLAQDAEVEVSGSAQGIRAARARVDRVEILERGGDDESRAMRGGDLVYDLEVEDNHNYVAGGLLVHNCHNGQGHKRWAAIPGRDAEGNDTRSYARLENRVAAAARITANAKRRLGLTATFIPDRVRNLWGELDLIHPGEWGKYWGKLVRLGEGDNAREVRVNSFTGRYCDLSLNDFGGWDDRGESNLEELKSRLRFVMHKVDSSVTHRDLPPKRRQIVYLTKEDQNAPSAFTEELKKAQAKGSKSLREVRLAEAASRKRGYVIDEVVEAVKSKQKVVIFTGRHKDCERLDDAIRKALKGMNVPIYMAHGGHGTLVRDQLREQWMGNPAKGVAPMEGPAVLIGTAQAWGESVSLNHTHLALMVMLPINAKELWQREGRFYRQGQKIPVIIKYIVAEGTYDEAVASILLSKLPAVADIHADSQFVEATNQFMGRDNTDDIEARLTAAVMKDPADLFREFADDGSKPSTRSTNPSAEELE